MFFWCDNPDVLLRDWGTDPAGEGESDDEEQQDDPVSGSLSLPLYTDAGRARP